MGELNLTEGNSVTDIIVCSRELMFLLSTS